MVAARIKSKRWKKILKRNKTFFQTIFFMNISCSTLSGRFKYLTSFPCHKRSNVFERRHKLINHHLVEVFSMKILLFDQTELLCCIITTVRQLSEVYSGCNDVMQILFSNKMILSKSASERKITKFIQQRIPAKFHYSLFSSQDDG